MGLYLVTIATGQITPSTNMALRVAIYIDQPRALAPAGTTNLLLVTFLIHVSAMILGTGFLDETLLSRHFMGMAKIAVGLASIDDRIWNCRMTKSNG